MREIKYRALLDRTKYDSSYKHWFYSEEMGLDKFFALVVGHNLEPLQFTGLKDKNSKEIYEGDIVKCGSKQRIVEYHAEYKTQSGCWMMGQIFFMEGQEREVIGNSYENKELL